MFLSSLTESSASVINIILLCLDLSIIAIAVPIGMKSKDELRSTASTLDILDALVKAEKHLSAHLHMSTSTGNIIKIRETVMSLVLVYAFRTSLGDRREDLPSVIGVLLGWCFKPLLAFNNIEDILDSSASLTLRHDMLDAIDHKFPLVRSPDDVQWPSPQSNQPHSPPVPLVKKIGRTSSLSSDDDEDDADLVNEDSYVKHYWQAIRQKYQTQILEPLLLSSEAATLPNNWTVVNISVTADKSTLLCCRREGGNDSSQPLIFCIPLKERREQAGGDGDHLTFDGALSELQDIIHASNESTKNAVHIKPDDENARSHWWKQRGLLDVRLRELLENIEYCWLGAFKVFFSSVGITL